MRSPILLRALAQSRRHPAAILSQSCCNPVAIKACLVTIAPNCLFEFGSIAITRRTTHKEMPQGRRVLGRALACELDSGRPGLHGTRRTEQGRTGELRDMVACAGIEVVRMQPDAGATLARAT